MLPRANRFGFFCIGWRGGGGFGGPVGFGAFSAGADADSGRVCSNRHFAPCLHFPVRAKNLHTGRVGLGSSFFSSGCSSGSSSSSAGFEGSSGTSPSTSLSESESESEESLDESLELSLDEPVEAALCGSTAPALPPRPRPLPRSCPLPRPRPLPRSAVILSTAGRSTGSRPHSSAAIAGSNFRFFLGFSPLAMASASSSA